MTWNPYPTEITITNDPSVIKAIIPPILYKYRTWDNPDFPFHKTILTGQNLYFSPADDFSDPSDCRFPVKFDFTKERIEAYFMHDLRKSGWTNAQINAFAEYKYKEDFGTTAKLDQKKRDFYKMFNQSLGILCLCHQNKVLSMWSEYADNFNGFCVGLSLGEQSEDLVNNIIFGGKVDYVEHDFPALDYVWEFDKKDQDLIVFFRNLIMTKYENYLHEDEYRFGKYLLDARTRNITPKDRTYTLAKSAYKEVVFGHKLAPKAIEEIVEVCEKQHLKVEFKMAYPGVSLSDITIEPYRL
jgi:hypothetical protein